MNTLSHCFAREGGLVTRCIAGEMIIVRLSSHVADLDYLYILSELGDLIWDSLVGAPPWRISSTPRVRSTTLHTASAGQSK